MGVGRMAREPKVFGRGEVMFATKPYIEFLNGSTKVGCVGRAEVRHLAHITAFSTEMTFYERMVSFGYHAENTDDGIYSRYACDGGKILSIAEMARRRPEASVLVGRAVKFGRQEARLRGRVRLYRFYETIFGRSPMDA